jgi:hypothetical protein
MGVAGAYVSFMSSVRTVSKPQRKCNRLHAIEAAAPRPGCVPAHSRLPLTTDVQCDDAHCQLTFVPLLVSAC